MRGLRHRWGTALAAIVVGAVISAGCGGGDDTPEGPSFTPPRTYEQLDLSTPLAAVAEFESAFVRRDYVTAALILHRDTQAAMAIGVAEGDLRGLVTPDAAASVLARVTVERGGDHFNEAGRVFEVAMEEAMSNGGLPVDLASGVDGLTERSSDRFTAVVDGILAANGSDVVFELAPSVDGRWRVRAVRLTNGTPLEAPFSGTPSQPSPARATEPTDVWRSTLPNGDPQELLETITTLVAEGDHVSLYLLLDESSQRDVVDQLAARSDPDHALAAAVLDARLDETGLPVDLEMVDRIPSETMTTSEQVGPGEALTFAVTTDDGALDVTMSRDSTGGWRLRRMVPVGDLAAPSPFPIS